MEKPTMHMLSVQEKGGETRKANQYIAAVAGMNNMLTVL